MKEREITYSELKESYLFMQNFVRTFVDETDKINLKTKIVDDLGLWGDDNERLLVDLRDEYNVNFDNFDYDKYFESETTPTLLGCFLGLILLPLYIIKGLFFLFFRIISKRLAGKFHSMTTSKSNKKDLTFGDLVACYLEKEFILKENISYILIKNTH